MTINFIIAGTQKSGTTSLDAYLRQHPQLAMADIKELHFFDRDELFHTPPPDYAPYHLHFAAAGPDALKGECTPAYTWHVDAMRRIWNYNPKIKLIVLLRNPILRAWSHWNMSVSRGVENLPFSQAICTESQRLRQALPRHSKKFSYVDRGYYSEQIHRIDRFFPREQVLFLKSEPFFQDPAPSLRQIFQFLQVDSVPIDTSRMFNPAPAHGEIAPEDRAYLSNLYRWEIKETESLLNWSCPDWQ